MKPIFAIAPLFCLVACGELARYTEPGKTAPNPATKVASDPNVVGEKPQPSWPTSGSIRCHVAQEPNFTADYEVVVSATSRVANVTFFDAWTGKTYTATEAHDLTRVEDYWQEIDKKYGAAWGWEADVAKGRLRGWGFALDIETMTLFVNTGLAYKEDPAIAGWTAGYRTTDCQYIP